MGAILLGSLCLVFYKLRFAVPVATFARLGNLAWGVFSVVFVRKVV